MAVKIKGVPIESPVIVLILTMIIIATLLLSGPALGELKKRNDVWKKVDVVVPNRVSNKGCSVKVGHPYIFKSYGFGKKIVQALKIVGNPSSAAKQRVLTAYNINDISVDQWHGLKDEFGANPPANFAVLKRTNDGFVGAPVKWEDGLAGAINTAIEHDANKGEKNTTTVAIQIEEILGLAAVNRAKSAVDEESEINFVGSVVGLNLTGNINTNTKYYVAFSAAPTTLMTLKDSEPVITVEGAFGEDLGRQIVPWPRDRGSIPNYIPPGCR